jgi:hypothetical protein
MHTFDASIRSRAFWLAVIIPPTGYWILVQLFAWQAGEGTVPLMRFIILIGLANILPLAALGWMVCSVAAYTVSPGRLIEHRVVRDREFVFGPDTQIAQLSDGDIAVCLPGRTLRLRVKEPSRCLARLRDVAREGDGETSEILCVRARF